MNMNAGDDDVLNIDITTLTRTELYNFVWSQPLATLAKQFDISDTGLRKICVKMDIPLPKAGY